MKRAKIMLLAIAIIATVGGALAFKAQKFSEKNVYCLTSISGQLTCNTTNFKTIAIGEPLFFTTPCRTWHAAINSTTTSYLTTCEIGAPLPALTTVVKVTGTNVE